MFNASIKKTCVLVEHPVKFVGSLFQSYTVEGMLFCLGTKSFILPDHLESNVDNTELNSGRMLPYFPKSIYKAIRN